jgi:hypothetical protein
MQSFLFGSPSIPVESGLYSPTLTVVTNIDTISLNTTFSSYVRVGDIVMVFSSLYINPTAAAACEFSMSIPIAADFSAGTARANGVLASGLAAESGRVQANTATDDFGCHFVAANTSEHTFCVTASYRLA